MNLVTAKDVITARAAIAAIGVSAVALPGVRQVIEDAVENIQRWEREAVCRSLLEELSPDSRQAVALQELGVSHLVDGYASGVEILPIRKRPLKPKPRGRKALVKRQKKAR